MTQNNQKIIFQSLFWYKASLQACRHRGSLLLELYYATIFTNTSDLTTEKCIAWNKGKLLGQKTPLKLREIWAIRTRLEMAEKIRDLALFNLAIDSKPCGCDLVSLKVRDIFHGNQVMPRAMILQKKTNQSVQFEITKQTRESISSWIKKSRLSNDDYLFQSRFKESLHLSTRQYARIVKNWVLLIGLDPKLYGTHTMRRTKATLIYRRTKNIRAVQLLLGHTKLESTVRYLGIKVDDALELSEQTEV